MSKQQHLIKRSNNLISASNNMPIDTKNLFFLAICKLSWKLKENIEQKDLYHITITTDEIKQIFKRFRIDKNIHQRIDKATDKLVTSSIGVIYNGKEDFRKLGSAASEAKYKNHKLDIWLNPRIMNYIKVEKEFKISYIEPISDLSNYQLCIYDICIQYIVRNNIRLQISEVRRRLNISEKKYKETPNLLNKIINPSVLAINKDPKCNITITADAKKTGRKFTHIEFTMHYRNPLDTLIDTNSKDITDILNGLGLKAGYLLKKYEKEILLKSAIAIKKQLLKKDINNISNYFHGILLNKILKKVSNKDMVISKKLLLETYKNSIGYKKVIKLFNEYKLLPDLIPTIIELEALDKNSSAYDSLSKTIEENFNKWLLTTKIKAILKKQGENNDK